ncbi:hypothetical protein MTR_1g016160 [Medicago truncatula]|uniref:Uncharacterized protein n=1 Tax=Medicago truncatula TaxID=3880 RepID=G7I9Y3_MEDTR|nr:hypothetical protein MTR_1g016160 [Medicago truncatula]
MIRNLKNPLELDPHRNRLISKGSFQNEVGSSLHSTFPSENQFVVESRLDPRNDIPFDQDEIDQKPLGRWSPK